MSRRTLFYRLIKHCHYYPTAGVHPFKMAADRRGYLVNFGSVDKKKSVFNYVRKRFAAEGLHVTDGEFDGESYLIISATKQAIASKAEELQVIKPLKNCDDAVEFTIAKQSMFQHTNGDIFTPSEEVWLLYRIIQSTNFDESALKLRKKGRGKGFLTYLKTCKPAIVVDDYPLHCTKDKRSVVSLMKKSIFPWTALDPSCITNYFGEEIGFYFAWMGFYSKAILLPLLIGLLLFLLRPQGSTVDTDAYLPFYSVFVATWAVLFIVFWQRQSAVYSYHWNTYNLSLLKEYNPEYHGTLEKDPITNELILQYPQWKRRMWYLFSFLAMVPLLVVGVLVMALSLNLNGYVKDPNSPIYAGQLAEYAKPGGIFAADSSYYGWLVPTIVHSIFISIINKVYSSVAEFCTNLENHKTVREWQNSLIIKRVFFECFDCFLPLFYIAFYQLDVITLRAELVSLFMSDEIRRILLESVIPIVKEFIFSKRKAGNKPSFHYDFLLDEYDLFDDYLEMVIQFGYITLFASAFTLGPLVTLVFLYLEVRSDLFKLLYAYRRPLPRRVKDIGVWSQVMNVMVMLSIGTNCAILGFGSEQLMQWFPWMFSRLENDGDQTLALGSGRYVVGIVFGTEHLILLLAAVLRWVVPTVPEWVRVAIAKREYQKHKKQS